MSVTKLVWSRLFGGSLLLVAVAGVWLALAGSASAAPLFNQCPAIGQSAGCSVLFTINADGSVTSAMDPAVGPYDGAEDSLVGVVNNSTKSVTSIPLVGPDIFGFDDDGLCTATGAPAGCPFDGSGYAGPKTTFTVTDSDHGTVNFTGGLAAGATAYFSLEGDPAAIVAGPPAVGYVELCKTANPASNQLAVGNFTFTITDITGIDTAKTVTIPIGTCSQPIQVVAGPVTIVENGSDTGLDPTGTVVTTPQGTDVATPNPYLSATWSSVGPTGPGPSGTGFTSNITVPASPNSSANTVTVTYSNAIQTGVIEVCKAIVAGSGLTGSWQFTITGANAFKTVVTVPAGNCSSPITVPAGLVKVQETGDPAENVTAITATQNAGTTNAIAGPLAGPAADLPNATVVAHVAIGDASKETLVTMTNDSVRLKLCKYVDQGLLTSFAASYPFSLTYAGSALGGPNSGPLSESLAAGNSFATAVCTIVGTFRAGTTVGIAEGPTAGTKVGSITVNPAGSAVPGSLSLPNGMVSVVLGAGETVVTYEDIPALPGVLKLCKVAGTAVANGTVFSFTVNTSTVTVPAGSCVVIGGFAFGSKVNITEAAAANITVGMISATPTPWVQVLEAGVETNTNIASLIANTATRTATAVISENETTEVTYLNNDPPPVDTTGGTTTGGTTTGGTTGTTSGSSGGSNSNSGSSGSSNSSSSNGSSSSGSTGTTTPVVAASTGTGAGIFTPPALSVTAKTSATTNAKLTKALKLAKLKGQLATLKLTGAKLAAQLKANAKHPIKHKHLAKQLASVKSREAQLSVEIKQLQK